MPPLGKSVAAWKKDYEQLEQSYARQQRMLEEIQGELRRVRESTKDSTAVAVKDSLRNERKQQTKKAESLKEMASATGKAASLASGIMIGYYLIAEELDLWVVSEDFTRSEWFQAVCTAALSWLLVQSYRMTARK